MADRILSFLSDVQNDPFDVLFDTAPIMLHSIDPNGQLIKVSTFWADALGYARDEMLGRKFIDFLTPASQVYARDEILPRYFETGRLHNVEYDFQRKDGTVLPVLLSATSEYDAEGEFKRSLAIMFDNTEAKRAKAELAQKQRMEAVGNLVGGVAHDFNNILSVIQGNLEFLNEDKDHALRDVFMHDALGAAQRGAMLTQQLLSFGRRAQLSPQPIDLNAIIRETDGMLRRLMPANIEFETVATGGLWKTMLDRVQLDTAVLNIVNNARDAMPNGGQITVETGNIRISQEYVADHKHEIKPGRYVMLAISDTGEGMMPEVSDRAFDPFFTTKAVGKGTGLGLSMVHGFVRQSGGTVQLYSEIGFGTTIKMYFPAVGTAGSDKDAKPIEEPIAAQPVMADILVVEDEPDVRKVLVRQLASRGLKVAEASSGDLAHGLLVTGYMPRVMVTDVVMPGKMQGPDLAREARLLVPDIKVVFVSGYPNEAAINGNGLRVQDRQLVKPVSRDTLLKAVMEMLEEDD